MGDHFAFLLPATFWVFGCTFLIVWRVGMRPALLWGAAYLCAGTGFTASMWPAPLPEVARALSAEVLFIAAFFLFGEALVARTGGSVLRRLRLGVALTGFALTTAAIARGDLRAELLLSDLSCALLLALGLAGMRGASRLADRALFAAACLVVTETVVRGATVFITVNPDGTSFLATTYAFLMQACAGVIGVVFALAALAALTSDLIDRYRDEALTDPLSGLLNRRGFAAAVARAVPAEHGGGSLVTCDIDHFKQVNDRFGHAAGDRVIADFARIIRDRAPSHAIAARMGGEEFAIYLPGIGTAEATRFANSVRLAFSASDHTVVQMAAPLTASFGLAAVEPDDAGLTRASARADAGLYHAKTGGRDRVSFKLELVSSAAPPQDHPSRAQATQAVLEALEV